MASKSDSVEPTAGEEKDTDEPKQERKAQEQGDELDSSVEKTPEKSSHNNTSSDVNIQ